ncbi:MAG: orotate phosphoribosyltransferase [Calditrichaeota bacterium]|nr:orotate phosphoribosyltransferase [Calditrichota bacterium]
MNQDITKQIQSNISNTFAMLLWENGAVKVNNEEPFKLASGAYSPIYINCRQVISHPPFMQLFTAAVNVIRARNGLKIDAIAGGETAGIPFGAYLAQSMSLPFYYVRKAAKKYGIANLVEGGNVIGKHVMLIEDLITDGGSKLHFIEALRANGATVENVMVLFDRNQGGEDVLGKEGCQLHSITDLNTTLNVADEMKLVPEESLISVKEYLNDTKGWQTKK